MSTPTGTWPLARSWGWFPNLIRLEGGAGTNEVALFNCDESRRQDDAIEDRHVVCTTPGTSRGEEERRGRNVEGEGGLKAARPPLRATRPNIIQVQACLSLSAIGNLCNGFNFHNKVDLTCSRRLEDGRANIQVPSTSFLVNYNSVSPVKQFQL